MLISIGIDVVENRAVVIMDCMAYSFVMDSLTVRQLGFIDISLRVGSMKNVNNTNFASKIGFEKYFQKTSQLSGSSIG